jgi:hypothetical protein
MHIKRSLNTHRAWGMQPSENRLYIAVAVAGVLLDVALLR